MVCPGERLQSVHDADCRRRREAHGGSDSSVRLNDVAFALHATALTALTLGQYAAYGSLTRDVSPLCIAAVALWGILAVTVTPWSLLGLLYALSAAKLCVTLGKYAPQARPTLLCVALAGLPLRPLSGVCPARECIAGARAAPAPGCRTQSRASSTGER